jgi:hypothetical protein
LENILESSIISLQDGVFGAQEEREIFLKCILEAGMGKTTNGIIRIVPRIFYI